MKRKFLYTLAFLCVFLFALAVGCGGKGEASFVLAESKYWLDRYEEKTIELTSGDLADLTFKSGDENIVTVENGRLVAQGEGSTTVTVTGGKHSQKISVRVRNSGVKPKIGFDEFDAYLGVTTEIPKRLNYTGKDMFVENIDYQLTLEDTSYLNVDGNSVTGLKLGSVDGVLTSSWKGLSLRKEVTINVLNPLHIELDESEITLYNVSSKLGKAQLGAYVYELTNEIVDAKLQYSIVSGEECIRIENGVVYAESVGEAEILISYTHGQSTATATVQVTVNPDYIPSYFEKPASIYSITWEKYNGAIGGRTGEDLYEYRAGEDVASSNCFDHRVVIENDEDKVMELYRQGYRYFAYDLYYTSNQNLMIGAHNLTSWIGVGDYFRRDYMQIVADGEAVNRLEKNRWITVVYDLKALWNWDLNLPSNFFFFVNDPSSSCYIMNVRYYLGDSIIPDENLVYENKGDYVQATNDEFDIRVPVSKHYNMTTGEPSLVVTEDTVPLYGEYEYEVGGRTGVYRYETQSRGSVSNSIVIAKSLNQTYDDGMYQMSKLGDYLTYDIYPQDDCTITFRMNGEDTSATVTTDKTNVAQYENWLIVMKDGKKQSTIVAGEWQTIVIAFVENYGERYSYSGISFAAEGAGDVVYVDNVRYYKTGDFIPTAYADDKNGPYKTADTANVSLQKAETGSFKGAYEYLNKESGEHGALSFKGVTTVENQADYFFNDGYRYVKFYVYLAENVQSITLQSVAERNFKNYTVTLAVGETFAESLAAVFNENGSVATRLERNKWYQIYLPVNYSSTDVGNVFVNAYTGGGSESAPAKAYIRYVSFEYSVRTPYVMTNSSISHLISLDWQNDGELAGSWRYENKSSGGDAPTTDYGNSGVLFSDLHDPVNMREGVFFQDGYQWIKVDFYMEESVRTFTVRFSAGKNNAYWVRNIPFERLIPENVYALNEDGERINVLNYNEWFTLYIPVQTRTVDDNWYMVCVYTNGGSEREPAVAYMKNLNYLRDWDIPEYPEEATSPVVIKPTLTTYNASWAEQVKIQKAEFNGETVWQYVNLHGGRNNEEPQYGKAGLCFGELTAGQSSVFFENGYRYIKLDFYATESVQKIDFRPDYHFTVDHNIWEEYVIGYTFNEAFKNSTTWMFYDTNGNRVTDKIVHNTWYTLWIAAKDVEYSQIMIQASGEVTETSAPTMYFKNASYEKEKTLSVTLTTNSKYDVDIELVTEGEFAGAWKYTNNNYGRANQTGAVTYGESGVYFAEAFNPATWNAESVFFKEGYQYVVLDFYATETVETLELRNVSENNSAWLKELAPNVSFYSAVFTIYDENGNQVTKWEQGKWYTLVIKPLAKDGVDVVRMEHLAIQANGNAEKDPPVMYLRNISYEKTNPFERAE